jgi:DNA polymerase-3 subunit delta'
MTLSPRTNPDLLGHPAAEQALLQAVRGQRLHHGWLITGPAGIGKATLAYRFARFLLAGAKGDTLQLDPEHSVFKRVASSGHADLLTVEIGETDEGSKRKVIIVDDVRKIEDKFRRSAAEGGWRIAIIDEADLMNTAAQNALLKILEEPPPGALLLLTASAPGRLLPTIRSRVRQLALQPLGLAELDQLLSRHLPALGADERRQLAQLAEGSIGRALALQEVEGVQLYRELLAILGDLPRLPSPVLLDYAERVGRKDKEERSPYTVLAPLLADWLASTARLSAAGEMSEKLPGEGAVAANYAAKLGLEPTLALWDNVRELFSQADGLNLDRKQTWLTALLTVKEAAA